jgi:uncharacterized protein
LANNCKHFATRATNNIDHDFTTSRMDSAQSILWRRIDAPGHDACTVAPEGRGWRVQGAAAFRSERGVAHLHYDIHCNANWQTQRATVHGMVGDREIDHRIRRTVSGVWTLDHVTQPQLANCTDLDLGFTPATNTIAIRRLALDMGAFADVRSAWLDVIADEFNVLEQRYMRDSNHLYRYESARFDYRATLRVNDFGLVTEYPELWVAEPEI